MKRRRSNDENNDVSERREISLSRRSNDDTHECVAPFGAITSYASIFARDYHGEMTFDEMHIAIKILRI